MPNIAIAQHPPVLLNKEATLQKAVELTSEAATQGAELIAFPETFIPGYPTWLWRLRPGTDRKLTDEIHEKLINNCVDLERNDLAPLQSIAREKKVTILCGINERDGKYSRTTIYNTYVTIGVDGTIQNRHRKLMPTNPERMVWGMGDGSGLNVTSTPVGRVGGLICWENYMPQARFALYAQGIEIFVAPTWDCGDGWIGTMQHIAREGRCWVLGSGSSLRASEIPPDFPGRDTLYPDPKEWVNPGDSVVVDPMGKIIAGPMHQEHGLLFAEIDLKSVEVARRTLDVAGHYSRPDIFRLTIDRKPRNPLDFEGTR